MLYWVIVAVLLLAMLVLVWRVSRLERMVEELGGGVGRLLDMFVSEQAKGTAGEVFLSHLLDNVLGGSYRRQVTLDAGLRVDYVLLLPVDGGKAGRLPVDAKFSGESKVLKRMVDQVARYVPYSDFGFAVMFVPSDAIVSRLPDDVWMYAVQKGVWICGPTGLYALIRSALALREVASVLARQREIAGRLAALGSDVEEMRSDFQAAERAMERLRGKLRRLIARIEDIVNNRPES